MYTGPPDPRNPAADITITVKIRDDDFGTPRRRRSRARATSRSTSITNPGEGNKFDPHRHDAQGADADAPRAAGRAACCWSTAQVGVEAERRRRDRRLGGRVEGHRRAVPGARDHQPRRHRWRRAYPLAARSAQQPAGVVPQPAGQPLRDLPGAGRDGGASGW